MADDTRTETDSLGSIDIAAGRYWGPQTERARRLFRIGSEHFPPLLIRAVGLHKWACAEANERLAEQVGYLNAPQNLAARADALGMVPAAGAGIVDAASGQIAPATARGDAAGLVTAHVGPPADADEARQGLAASAAAQAELAGPRTLTPEEAAAAASGSAAPAVEGGAGTPGPAEPTDGSDEH